jgi:hypothetical protein
MVEAEKARCEEEKAKLFGQHNAALSVLEKELALRVEAVQVHTNSTHTSCLAESLYHITMRDVAVKSRRC